MSPGARNPSDALRAAFRSLKIGFVLMIATVIVAIPSLRYVPISGSLVASSAVAGEGIAMLAFLWALIMSGVVVILDGGERRWGAAVALAASCGGLAAVMLAITFGYASVFTSPAAALL